MIPILYPKSAERFSRNGSGFLKDTVKAVVTEKRNGSFELSFQYPVTGRHFDMITDGCIVKVKARDEGDLQLFRIYKTSKPLNGIVTYSCEHISYDLNGLPLARFFAEELTAQAAMRKALNETPLTHIFTATSDITSVNSTEINEPCSVRGLLSGQKGSILDIWGGEFEFDNFNVILHSQRGSDNGVTIEYGKNLTALTQESSIAECYTHLMPYASYTEEGSDDPVYVYLPEIVMPINLIGSYDPGHPRALIKDFSEEFGDTAPTVSALRAFAEEFRDSSGVNQLKVNIKCSFLPLWQTEEYKNFACLEHVGLCDTVTVRHSLFGINVKAKVVETAYNVLEERYESLTIGDPKQSFSSMFCNQNVELAEMKKSIIRPITPRSV